MIRRTVFFRKYEVYTADGDTVEYVLKASNDNVSGDYKKLGKMLKDSTGQEISGCKSLESDSAVYEMPFDTFVELATMKEIGGNHEGIN